VYTMTTFNHYTRAFSTIGTILAICPPISNDHSVNYVVVGRWLCRRPQSR